MAHSEYSLTRRFNLLTEVSEVESKGNHLRQKNEETLQFGCRDILNVFHSRKVGVDNVGNDLLNGFVIAMTCLTIERIIAMSQILTEQWKYLCF